MNRARRDPDPPSIHVALMVTRRCNMSCAHCSVESGPRVDEGDPSEQDLFNWARQLAGAGVRSIRLTGGEPMLRAPVVLRLARECRRLGMATSLVTNGFWGRSALQARRHVRALKRAGVSSLTVSYDSYHADFQGPDPVLHIAAAAEAAGLPMTVNVVRGAHAARLDEVVRRIDRSSHAELRVYDVQAVGRARTLGPDMPAGDVSGFCTACSFPAVTDDGRLIACNGPAYFERPDSPLVPGSIRDTSVAVLLDRHRCDPIIDTIRTQGPIALRETLGRLPAFADFRFRTRYSGICELCQHITRDPAAVAALRTVLSDPAATARRHAAWQVISGHRRLGELSRAYVNGPGACRVFLGAARTGTFDNEAVRILGSAHLDWRRLAHYLTGSGLAGPLLRAMADAQIARWAPPFFRDTMAARAMTDGRRGLVQRQTIEDVADAIAELGGRGILLKGGGFVMEAAGRRPSRATGDVDILVEPAMAPRLRELLLARGFEGHAGSSALQHLEPVRRHGIVVEIHTRLMAPFWGLPEHDMIASAQPLAGSAVLSVLGPEARILHAVVHTAASCLSFGLKTAWDIDDVIRHSNVDWRRLGAWARATRMARAFWAPMRVLVDALDLDVPASFLGAAPRDAGMRRVELVARERLFRATDNLADLDALTKIGIGLLYCERWRDRAAYLGTKVSFRAVRPDTWRATAQRARRADVFHQAWRHYRQYRRAIAREP